jgi:methylenetetrahydrofolate reductase (NADPH)
LPQRLIGRRKPLFCPLAGTALRRAGNTRRAEPDTEFLQVTPQPDRKPGNDIAISFEFFPPKTPAMEETLWRSIERLAPLAPDYVSVTYGAGGSTRERTHATIRRILTETRLAPAAHLTCVGASRAEIDEIIRGYWQMGVRRMVALRGDPATGLGTKYEAHPDGYAGSADLVAAIRRIGDFGVSVAAYPERHPESASFDADIELLKRKIAAGADEAITHFFINNDLFESFVDRVRAAGIDIPIVPGLLPINNFEQTAKFAAKTGTSIPTSIAESFGRLAETDAEGRQKLAADIAAAQVADLIDRGFRRIHFYTLNRAALVTRVFDQLGLVKSPAAAMTSADDSR